MFDIQAIFLLSLAAATTFAEFTVEQAAAFADSDGDGIISFEEFNRWNRGVSAYQQTATIMTMTGEIPVSKFISVLKSIPKDPKDLSQYTAEDAANFADKDKNGVISAAEFDRWFILLPPGHDKTATVLLFTGNIPIDNFAAVLDQGMKSSPFPTEYTLEQAVSYANRNRDDEIDAREFDMWYAGVGNYRGKRLREALTHDTDVITVENFTNMLSSIQELLA